MVIDKKLLEEYTRFTLRCEPEDMGVKEAFDDLYDDGLVQGILDDVAAGNTWAWCQVEVTATFDGVSESAYLGACSYEDEADFMADNYYNELKREALGRLKIRLTSLYANLEKLSQ